MVPWGAALQAEGAAGAEAWSWERWGPATRKGPCVAVAACVGGWCDRKSMEVTVPPGGWQPSQRLQLFPRWDRTTEAETKVPHMLVPGCHSRVGSGREGGGGFPILQARDASDSGQGAAVEVGVLGVQTG